MGTLKSEYPLYQSRSTRRLLQPNRYPLVNRWERKSRNQKNGDVRPYQPYKASAQQYVTKLGALARTATEKRRLRHDDQASTSSVSAQQYKVGSCRARPVRPLALSVALFGHQPMLSPPNQQWPILLSSVFIAIFSPLGPRKKGLLINSSYLDARVSYTTKATVRYGGTMPPFPQPGSSHSPE